MFNAAFTSASSVCPQAVHLKSDCFLLSLSTCPHEWQVWLVYAGCTCVLPFCSLGTTPACPMQSENLSVQSRFSFYILPGSVSFPWQIRHALDIQFLHISDIVLRGNTSTEVMCPVQPGEAFCLKRLLQSHFRDLSPVASLHLPCHLALVSLAACHLECKVGPRMSGAVRKYG